MADANATRVAGGRAYIIAELLKICATEVRHTTDADGRTFYAVIDFLKRVCSGKTSKAVYSSWDYFRTKSKFKNEIASFTRKLDFRYESAYSPSQDGRGRENETPAATAYGLQRLLAILTQKHVAAQFHDVVAAAKAGFIPIDVASSVPSTQAPAVSSVPVEDKFSSCDWHAPPVQTVVDLSCKASAAR